MKLKHKILMSLSILFGVAMTSCVDESLNSKDPDKYVTGDTPFYVKLRLKSNDSGFSRASDENKEWGDDSLGSGFQDGEHKEHEISSDAGNIAIFFDKDKKYISWAKLYSVNETSTDTPDDSNPDPESTYSCRFYGFADREPAMVMVVVNLDPNSDAYKNLTNFPGWDVEDVMKQVWAAKYNVVYSRETGSHYEGQSPFTLGYFIDNKSKTKYFTMTNSTYIEGVGQKGDLSKAKLHCAEEIKGNFSVGKVSEDKYKSSEEIIAQTKNLAPVTVYLERMVSKFQMTPSPVFSNYYQPINAPAFDVCEYKEHKLYYSEKQWGLRIVGWGLNGLESQNYLFKNLPDLENGDTDWLKHEDWSSNSEYNRRSYWSIDPHYKKEETGDIYPWQFDFARDTYNPDGKDYYEHFHSYDNQDSHGYDSFALVYFPFTKFCPFYNYKEEGTITTFPGKENSFTLDSKNYIYTPENTFIPGMTVDRSRGSRAYELAGTHLLVCAQLMINGEPYNDHIYRNRVGVTYLDELSMFEDFMNAVLWKLEGQRYMYYRYYPWDDSKVRDSDKGVALRAVTKGKHALYYCDDTNEKDIKYYRLTDDKLSKLSYDKNKYRLWREADAINGDGKVIPWIMYNDRGHFKPFDLYILSINEDDFELEENGVINANSNYNIYIENNGEKVPKPVSCADYIRARKLSFQYSVDKEWKDLEDSDRDNNDIQSLFYEIWGVADDYNHGLMYYAVPIHVQNNNGGFVTHKNGMENMEDDANPDFIDDPKLYYYYGVIRNNWYKFNIHSINDIGVPVSDPAKPIVPNYINKKDQIKVNIEIMQWHIEDQTVEINN